MNKNGQLSSLPIQEKYRELEQLNCDFFTFKEARCKFERFERIKLKFKWKTKKLEACVFHGQVLTKENNNWKFSGNLIARHCKPILWIYNSVVYYL